ncbi:MAG: signal peptidase II [Rubrobacteraceae bacterium]
MSRRSGILVATVVGVLVFLLDQGMKWAVETYIGIGASVSAIPGVLRLTHIKNSGGAFGILGGSQVILLVGSVLAVLVVLWMLLASPPSRFTALGCGLVLGGAAGNLLDRLTAGAVTDYADLQFWPLGNWPIFNAADTAIVAGVILLLLAAFSADPDRENTGPQK